MSGDHLSGSTGVSEAAEAFSAAMDAESPSRTRQARPRKDDSEKQALEDVFPQRNMDRSEPEGGARDAPEPARRARSQAPDEEDDSGEGGPRHPEDDDPNEGNDVEGDDEADDEPQDEDPDERDEDEDQEASAEFDPNLIVRITVDGEPVEVSLGEMSKGYIRQETFHRRMGELGQGVQALHQAKLELDQLHAAHAARAQELESYVEAFLPKEPDWDTLFRTDATQATYLKHQWDEFQRRLYGLQANRQAAEAERQRALHERVAQFANAGRARLAALYPEWRNEKVWRRDNESMRRTAREAGYTDPEMEQLYDPRAVTVLLKASRYDRMMAAKPKPVRNGASPPTKRQSGATPPPRNASRSFDRAERRLSRTGSVRDAATVFERILDREG